MIISVLKTEYGSHSSGGPSEYEKNVWVEKKNKREKPKERVSVLPVSLALTSPLALDCAQISLAKL